MSAKRLFAVSMVIALVVIVVSAISPAVAATGGDHTFTQSKKEALREFQLGERYGELPENIGGFSPEQIQREYELGERYGETPARFSAEQIWREYWLGERYGQTP